MAAFSLTPGGVFNSLSNGATYSPVPLDSQTQGLINDQATRATSTDYGGLLNKNVQAQGSAAMAAPTPQATAAKFGSAGGDTSTIQAIRNQYNKTAQKSINQVMQRNQWQAPMTQADQLRQAAQGALAQQQVETRNYEGLMNAYNASLNARAQVIGSVLSLGGTGAAVAASAKGNDPAASATTQSALEQVNGGSSRRSPMGATNNDYGGVAQYGDPYKDYGNGYGWFDNGDGAPGYFGRTS